MERLPYRAQNGNERHSPIFYPETLKRLIRQSFPPPPPVSFALAIARHKSVEKLDYIQLHAWMISIETCMHERIQVMIQPLMHA